MSLATKSCDAWKQVGEEAPKFVTEWFCSQEERRVQNRAESVSGGVPKQLSMSCQLFITQTRQEGTVHVVGKALTEPRRLKPNL